MSNELGPPPRQGPVVVKVQLSGNVYERLWTAAARDSVSFTSLLNRAVEVYDEVLATPAGRQMKISDPLTGREIITIAILHNPNQATRPRPPRRGWWHKLRRH
ncbi:MAG: hypothetical protein ABWY93_04715 [Mycobacterium sp.]